MNCCGTIVVTAAFQINLHPAVAIDAIMAVVYPPDLLMDFRLLGMIIRLPIFPVVVISIRADSQAPQQPANAKFCMMLFDESISL